MSKNSTAKPTFFSVLSRMVSALKTKFRSTRGEPSSKDGPQKQEWEKQQRLDYLQGSTPRSQFYDMSIPRGIRLNNPGNIRKGATQWRGMADIQPDQSFVTFRLPEWGIRAIMMILRAYRDRYFIRTIREVVHRWAPPSENQTEIYVQAVSHRVGISPDKNVDLMEPTILFPLVAAIIYFENGQMPYNADTLREAAILANALPVDTDEAFVTALLEA